MSSDIRTRKRHVNTERSNSANTNTRTAAEVVKRCEKIIEALSPFLGCEGQDEKGWEVLPSGDETWRALKIAYEASYDLHFQIPDIQAWLVGYHWGHDGGAWSTWYACRTEDQANRLCKAAQKVEDSLGRRTSKQWEVRFGGARPTELVRRTFNASDAEEHLSGR